MLKRTLIAITVVALLATSAQALGPDPETGTYGGKYQGFKIHPIKMDIFWPFVEYKALDLCVIPVKMEIGIMVQIEECNKKKIVLKQVECGDLGLGGGDWPCYTGCVNIKVRSNFDIKLGLKTAKIGPVLDKWKAYFDGADTVDAVSGWNTLTVCVDAWKAKIYEVEALPTAGQTVDVGTVTVTVKPNV